MRLNLGRTGQTVQVDSAAFAFAFMFEGAVSRNSAKAGNYKIPVKLRKNVKVTA